MSALEWGALISLGLTFGASMLFINIAVKEVPPATLILVRVVLGGAVLIALMAWQGYSFRPFIEDWRNFVILGILNCALPFFLIAMSQKHIGAGLGGILNATVPIFIVPLAHFMTHDEKLTAQKILGVLAGFAGVVVLIGPSVFLHEENELWGELLALGASLTYALAGLQARKFKKYPPLVTSVGNLIFAAIIMLPISLFYDQALKLPMPSTAAISAVLWLVLLLTILGYLSYYWLVNRVGATNTSLVTFIIPVGAVIFGVTFNDESLDVSEMCGMLIIGFSLLLIDGRLWRKRADIRGETIHEGTISD